MRLQDHVHIIGTVANSQSDLLGISLLDQIDDIGLLLGGHTASQYDIRVVSQRYKRFLEFRILCYSCERGSTDDNGLFDLIFISSLNFGANVLDLLPDITLFRLRCNQMLIHSFLEEAGG